LDTISEGPIYDESEEKAEILVLLRPMNASTIPKAPRVTTIKEIACNESEWHIARLSNNFAKAYFAQHATTKKKLCVAKIVQDNKGTTTQTYIGNINNYKKNMIEVMQFFFCNDDIERCIKGLKQKWVLSKPEVPNISPKKYGTSLTQKEMIDLQNGKFHLLEHIEISLKRLFGNHKLPPNIPGFQVRAFSVEHRSTRFGKKYGGILMRQQLDKQIIVLLYLL